MTGCLGSGQRPVARIDWDVKCPLCAAWLTADRTGTVPYHASALAGAA